MLGYTAIAALLCLMLGRSVDFRLTLYFLPFVLTYLLCIGVLAVVVGLHSAADRSAQPCCSLSASGGCTSSFAA
jgi:hypothetical protein